MGHVIIIFGGSGDLTKRKLIPALYRLYEKGELGHNVRILGVGRSSYSHDEYRAHLSISDGAMSDEFLSTLFYLTADPAEESTYKLLKEILFQFKETNYLFYLATPPSLYETIAVNLEKVSLHKENFAEDGIKSGTRRIIVEKPFGYNLDSAVKMNSILKRVFREGQIFRIDHYLGKETVQNILALRFANSIFEPIWNRNYIESVEITAVENMGIENRGGFYDKVGALRDMVQNHLIQLLALVAMEPPIIFEDKEFRDEVVKVYNSLKPLNSYEIPQNVIRGQYIAGEKGGIMAKAYREENGVASDSLTETFLAMRVNISNWRWEGVPFYIRTGKQMPTKVTEIIIHFKQTPHRLFSCRENCPAHNQLVIRIQPNEGIVLKYDVKIPGGGFNVTQVPMEFVYDKISGLSDDAYARLILESLNGESTLFTRSDAVEASWRYFDKILSYWEKHPETPLYGYPAGSWGPLESEKIISRPTGWSNPCKNLTNTNLYCEL